MLEENYDSELNSLCIELQNENTALIDLDQNESEMFSIAALEQSRDELSAKNNWSVYTKKPVSQHHWESMVQEALEPIAEDNPYQMLYPNEEISAISAVNFKPGSFGLDVRPKVYDNLTKTWTLLDSGSCVTCVPKKPGDKPNPNFKLKSVNGSRIETFGHEVIDVRIGRKNYQIQAVKADVPHKILGWDFFKKYSLGFDWDEFGELYLTDKKADIRALLKHVTLLTNDAIRIELVDQYQAPSIQPLSNEAIIFQTECMKWLNEDANICAMSIDVDQKDSFCDETLPLKSDPDTNKVEVKNLKTLETIAPKYAEMIRQFPNILKTSFKKEPASNIYHRIELTSDEPCTSKVRPLLANSEKSEVGRQMWKEMETMGVIERVKQDTTIQYSSPLHLVKKPNSKNYRICADFRALNARTKRDNYPLPLLRSFTHKIKGSKVFSKLDMTSAFHHLPIHPDDVSKTCVLSPWGGAFVFKRLAFGLTNGPSSWQKYVDGIFKDIEGLYCYLDDILLYTDTEEQHMSLLKKVFQRLEEHDLTLALDKCVFGRSTMDYLGYEVSSTGIRPLNRKVEAIQKIPKPESQKSLLHFLGALNYFRNCLSGLVKNGVYHNAANLLQPLYTAGTVKIQSKDKFSQIWDHSPVLQEAFQDAKKLLKNAAELSHPDPKLPLALWTDASQHSIGAVLMQQNVSGKWIPLGYMSKHLPIEKVNWATYRKELFAVQAGIRYFISEIYGRHCTVYSDHAPLVSAFKNQGFQLHDPVAQRALMEIGQFTRDIRHIAGSKNAGSDFLSRIPPDLKGTAFVAETVSALEGFKLISMSASVLFQAQQECEETNLLKQKKHPTSVYFEEIAIENYKILCEMSMSSPRPVLPKSLRKFVMKSLHNCGHTGIKESIRKISSHYYWNNMKTEITTYVQTCHGCQSVKNDKIKPPHFGQFDVPDQRFSHCHIDVVGPLPESNGFKYLLTTMDRTTRFLLALPLRDTSAKSCSEAFLLHHVAMFGVPSACTSDQGKNFISELFRQMQHSLGIDIKYTPIYWPQGNGLIERAHQSLKNAMKAELIEMGEKYQSNWYYYLPWALLGRRTAFNADLKTSSSELTFGTHVQVPGILLQEVSDQTQQPSMDKLLSQLQIKNNRVAIPTAKNEQVKVDPPSQATTHVYTKQHDVKGLQARFKGPFPIVERPSRSTILIKVGTHKDGSDRTELRTWADCKSAYRREGVPDAQRPKLGRPAKAAAFNSPPESDTILSNHPDTSITNVDVNNNVASVERQQSQNLAAWIAVQDFSKPPPSEEAGNSNQLSTKPDRSSMFWSPSIEELAELNRQINAQQE